MKLMPMIVLAVLSVGTAAFAQEPAGGGPSPEMQAARKAMMESCSADIKTLCDGKTGREAMMCMRDNADKVSAPCKDAMAKMMAARKPQ
jgi:hypothetical protein